MYKISVVVPVYNVEKYVIECLQSIVGQSFDDYEIIIVNDGSTDRSMEVVGNFIEGQKDISIIKSVNEGLSAARNKGLKVAQGEYIYFCDSDDYIEKDTLKICYEKLSTSGADVVIFGGNIFGTIEGKDKDQYAFTEKVGIEKGTICEGIDFYKRHYLKFALVNTPMMLFNRRYLLNNNLFYEKGLLHEDFEFYNHLISLNPKMVLLSDRFYNRRYRDGSIMSSEIQYKNIESYIEILHRMSSLKKELLSEEFEYVSASQLLYTLSMVDKHQIELDVTDTEKIEDIINSYHAKSGRKSIKELLNIVLIQEEYCKKLGINLQINGLNEVIKKKISPLYFEVNENEGGKIIIYGLGKWTLAFQRSLEMIYDAIETNLLFIDSFAQTGIDNLGRNVKNVKDVNWKKINTVLVISEKKEKEIRTEILRRQFHGKVIGLFSYYNEL